MQVPYHRADIGEAELAAIARVFSSGWLTSGPECRALENLFSSRKLGFPAIAVNSCTSGLFLALRCLEPGPGSEVITTPYTFVSTAHSILHNGATPIFADIDRDTLNIDPKAVEAKVTSKTRVLLPVHIGGVPCNMDDLTDIAERNNLEIIEDCAHAIEGEWKGIPLGNFGYASSFSFYANKNITTGEGGMLICRDAETGQKLRALLNHGLSKSSVERHGPGSLPLYDVTLPGFKMNLPDILAAVGNVQMGRIDAMYERRVELKRKYDAAFQESELCRVQQIPAEGKSALHLYPLLLELAKLKISRNEFLAAAAEKGVQLSVNYTPIHLFTWFRNKFGFRPEDFPNAFEAGESVISLPFFPSITDEEADYVTKTLSALLKKFAR